MPPFLGLDFASIVSYNEAAYPGRVLDDNKSPRRDHARGVTPDDDLRGDFVQARLARFARPLLGASQLNQTASGHAPSRPANGFKRSFSSSFLEHDTVLISHELRLNNESEAPITTSTLPRQAPQSPILPYAPYT